MVPYEVLYHLSCLNLSLNDRRGEPPVEPCPGTPLGVRGPRAPMGKAFVLLVDLSPAVDEAQCILHSLESPNIASTPSLRGRRLWGFLLPQAALVPKWVCDAVEVAPKEVDLRRVQVREQALGEEGCPLRCYARGVHCCDREGLPVESAGGRNVSSLRVGSEQGWLQIL
jgi:hypothetical protein